MTKIGILVGSLRKESYSKKIAKNVAALFPEGFDAEFVEIGNLPLYNQDFDDENNVPEEYTTFRNTIRGMDAILFVTPEYNRSVPAVLKNALDIGSRPPKERVWPVKPAAIISQSPGKLGGFGANHHLRQTLTFLNMPIVQQPEAYIGNVTKIIDENGKITDQRTMQLLEDFVNAFVDLIKRYQE